MHTSGILIIQIPKRLHRGKITGTVEDEKSIPHKHQILPTMEQEKEKRYPDRVDTTGASPQSTM